jgi:tripartite-type tricarboxylate transporter receptor subunit TctC
MLSNSPTQMPRLINRIVAVATMVAGVAWAQTYPVKPLRIVTGSPGSGIDMTSRLMAPGLANGLGQQVIVENRGGILSTEFVVKAAPDAHTLVLDGFTMCLTIRSGILRRFHCW